MSLVYKFVLSQRSELWMAYNSLSVRDDRCSAMGHIGLTKNRIERDLERYVHIGEMIKSTLFMSLRELK